MIETDPVAAERIRKDLEKKIAAQLEEVMLREITLASRVLPMVDVTLIAMTLAVAMTGAALSMLEAARIDGKPSGELFDLCASAIARQVAEMRPIVLARVEARRAAA